MKKAKLVSCLTATAMMMGMATVATAADGDVQINVGSYTGAAGDTFSIDVNLASLPATGLTSLDFAINYDTSVIDITGVTLGAAGNTGAAAQEGELGDTLFTWQDTGSQIVLIWATGLTDSNYWVKNNGVFVTITGTIAADAAEGASTALTVAPVDRAAYPGGAANTQVVLAAVGDTVTTYGYSATNGSVSVADTQGSTVDWGNVDCSEGDTPELRVTIADVVLLNRYVAEDNSITISDQGMVNADCAYDGQLTATDSQKIMPVLSRTLDYSERGNQ